MALKIRLKRMGNRNRPFYRLVVQDSAWRRDGKTVADVGWYDPVKQPAQMSFKEKEIYHWMERGAQPSETARSLLKRQGYIEKFRTGEYKAVMETEDAPAAVVTMPEEASAKPVEAPAAPVDPPVAENSAAEGAEASKEESADEETAKSGQPEKPEESGA